MTKKKILELLKSGNFTIYYYDNGQCALYEGKYKDEGDIDKEPVEDWGNEPPCSEGYIPTAVSILVKALNGNVITT